MQHSSQTARVSYRRVFYTALPVFCICLMLSLTVPALSAVSYDQSGPDMRYNAAGTLVAQQAPPRETQMDRVDIPADRGLLRGLLSGTLIGSLFFDEPFTGVGVADVLLLLVLVSLGVRILKNRSGASPAPRRQGQTIDMHDHPAGRNRTNNTDTGEESPRRPSPSVDIPDGEPNPHLYERAAGMWDHLKGDDDAPARKRAEGFTEPQQATRDDKPLTARDAYTSGKSPVVPEGFDTDDFLKGAKMVFSRLQQSWDARDMDDIAQFTTPEVHDEIKRQAAQDPTPSHSELLLVNARLLEVQQEENGLLATVFFDVLMRESRDGAQTEQVREIWHFLKSDEYAGIWRLDGIEHVSA